jgi:hypothetical protein
VAAKVSDVELFKLGAVLPFTPIRRSFQQIVDRNWEKGAAGLAGEQGLHDLLRDPGLLLVLKTVPWKARLKPKEGSGYGGGGGVAGGGFAGGPGRPAGDGEAKGKKKPLGKNEKNEAADQWLDITEQCVRTLSARFRAAPRGEGKEPPVRLPKDIEPRSVYYLKWPEELSPALKKQGVPEMIVHYVRVELHDRPLVRATREFSTLVPGSRHAHALDNAGSWWYESRVAGKDGKLRSYDIMVYRANTDGSAGSEPPATGGRKKGPPIEPINVDILYVEIANYQGS